MPITSVHLSPEADASDGPAPLVGLPCCTRLVGDIPTHWVGDKYVRAVSDAAGAVPLLLPALAERLAAADVVAWGPMSSRITMTARRASPARCTIPSATR
jgi:hypothetical protein